ncbi:hypothetical protein [Algirhabdus cladophorae]|uniref:hypothetical protein n=1 Tax=Algirhabdus cladophorae TaxID=3377108 RepID=UPI003B845377
MHQPYIRAIKADRRMHFLDGGGMEKFIRLTAPVGKIDFVFKLLIFMLIGGSFNHLRHVIQHRFPDNKSFWDNFSDAAFTALPMCAFALMLIGHLNSLQNASTAKQRKIH